MVSKKSNFQVAEVGCLFLLGPWTRKRGRRRREAGRRRNVQKPMVDGGWRMVDGGEGARVEI